MTEPAGLDKIKKKTIVSQVMDQIRQLIASGRYRPRDRIPTESELAEMLGIGRSSIREAIKVFNYLGVLESRTAKGTFVCERSQISSEALSWSILLGRDDYDELIDLRGAVESWSLGVLAARYRADPQSAAAPLAALEVQLEKMRQAIRDSDEGALAAADYDFHALVISGGGSRLFESLYRVLRNFMYEEIERSHRDFVDIRTIVAEHEEFLKAIRSGLEDRAGQVVRTHIASIKRRLARVLRKQHPVKQPPAKGV